MADASLIAPALGSQAPDPSLEGLDISKWTTVAVSNDFAARAMSLYFSTDHPLLCPFDRKLFTEDLISANQGSYCSRALVNALMYWCCLAYESIDRGSIYVVDLFRKEAEHLTEGNPNSPTPLDAATEMFLSLGYLMQGRDGMILHHLSNASSIGRQLGLFGIPEDVAQAALDRMTPDELRAAAYPAWGVFNWTVLMHLFYRQEGGLYPKYPPIVPAPTGESKVAEDNENDEGSLNETSTGLASKALDSQVIFASLCHFWTIVHEVAAVYYGNQTAAGGDPPSLQFAEFKFRELLTWADGLPRVLTRSQNDSDLVLIMHLWLHSAVLDIFRPFRQARSKATPKVKLRTFSAFDSTPDAAYNASVRQLKHLIVTYRSTHASSNYTIIWQTALLYTGSAMLRSADDDRLEYFLICLRSFQSLRRSFRVTEVLAKALLSKAIQQADISTSLASKILDDLRTTAPAGEEAATSGGLIRAPFKANLDVEGMDSEYTMEQLAGQFEESIWIERYTNIFYN
ncbi:hypothetical protein CC79DRAFT_1281978 [Sarocladium strictum]